MKEIVERLALVLAATVALSVLGADIARAGGDEALGDGKLARVKLGWEGFVPNDCVAPVSVTLTNSENRERTLRVVVTAWDAGKAEETVTVAPLATKRVTFALRIPSWTTVSVSEGSTLLARGVVTGSGLPDHAVLLVDGDPDSLQVPEVATGCIVVNARPEEMPGEVACLARFNGIVVRHLDPSRLDPHARAALEDLVRAGGTVIVVAPDDRPSQRAFYEQCDAATERTDGPLPARRRGLGTVLLAREDVGRNATGAQAQARAALGALLLATKRTPFPRAHLGEHPNESAATAGTLVGGFLLVYLLGAGPVFAFAMRKKKAAQVGRAFAIVLGVFILLGVGVAIAVRSGEGVVRVHTFVVVPAAGDAVAFADVSLQSAGGRTQDVLIEGDDVAATSFGRTGRRLESRPWRGERIWHTEAALTERAVGHHAVSFRAHPVPAFGETSVGVIAAAPGAKRLDARLVARSALASEVVITNTLDRSIGPILVCERAPRRGQWEIARAERLAKGATLRLPLQRTGALGATHLKIPPSFELVGWTEVGPTDPDGSLPRYVLFAEDRSPLAIKAPGARLEERAWLVQSVDAPALTVPGWLGVTVKKTERGVKIVSVAANSPASRVGWVLTPGRVITAVGGTPVRSPEDLRRALVAAGPGSTVRIQMSDQNDVDVELGDVPATETPLPVENGDGEGD